MLNVQHLDTRPIPAEAVQFLGTDKSARDLVDWAIKKGGDSGWDVAYTIDRTEGEELPKVVQRLWIRTKYQYRDLKVNSWVVFSEGQFEVLSTEELYEKYQSPENVESAKEQANLGLATTRELIGELCARIETDYHLGGGGLEYTTVDGRPSSRSQFDYNFFVQVSDKERNKVNTEEKN